MVIDNSHTHKQSGWLIKSAQKKRPLKLWADPTSEWHAIGGGKKKANEKRLFSRQVISHRQTPDSLCFKKV